MIDICHFHNGSNQGEPPKRGSTAARVVDFRVALAEVDRLILPLFSG
jgi:hypothetical protein